MFMHVVWVLLICLIDWCMVCMFFFNLRFYFQFIFLFIFLLLLWLTTMLLLFWFLLFCFSSTNDTFKYLQLLYIKIVFLVFYFWFFGFSFIFIICHFVTFFYIRSHPHTEPIGYPNQKSMSHFSLNRKTICYSPIYFVILTIFVYIKPIFFISLWLRFSFIFW